MRRAGSRHAGGGLLGRHPIQLFIRDTATRPETAVAVVRELIGRHRIDAVIGTYSSACAMAIKPLCRDAHVLHLATVSNSEDITQQDFSPYTFSVVPNTYMMANGLVQGVVRLAREKGWQRYATIASDYAWGRSSQSNQVKLLQAAAPDVQLVQAYWPPLGEYRFNAIIVDMQARKPDFILGTLGGADNAYWMRDARDYRLFKTIAYPGGLVSVSELITQAKSLRRGRYARCRAPFFAHLDVPMMRRFVDAYRAKFDRYPSDWAVMSYDGVQVLQQGVDLAGILDSDAVKDALRGAAVDTCRGRLFFRKIDNQLSCSAYFGRIADQPAYPFPVYTDLLELEGPTIWRPEAEILAARAAQE
jgi:branched-chain amino acid transport system substrate-binding protein